MIFWIFWATRSEFNKMSKKDQVLRGRCKYLSGCFNHQIKFFHVLSYEECKNIVEQNELRILFYEIVTVTKYY